MELAAIPIGTMGGRLALAALVGLVCGYERSCHGRAAGLRTTLLVAVASAMAMIVSENLFAVTAAGSATWRPDPARLAAGVLTGIGFLGAGTIIRQDNLVRGVTTAAVLWFVTIIGLAFGAGQIALGCWGFAIALVALFCLPHFEAGMPADRYGTIGVTTRLDGPASVEIAHHVTALPMKIQGIRIDHDLAQAQRTVELAVKFRRGDPVALAETAITRLVALPGVRAVKWQ